MREKQQKIDQLATIFQIALQNSRNCYSMKEEEVMKYLIKIIQPILQNTILYKDIQHEPSYDVLLKGRKVDMVPDLVVKTNDGSSIIVEIIQTNSKSHIERVNLRLYSILENINAQDVGIIGALLIALTPDGEIIRKIVIDDEIKYVRISEQDLGNGKSKMAIFVASSHIENPTVLLNKAVSKYVGTHGFNQFRDVNSNNPWVRIVITGINNLDFDAFATQRL